MDDNVPFAIVERETPTGLQFIEPRYGWAKEGRVYRTIFEEAEVAAGPSTPKPESE